ncbi:MAG: phosphatase PAP2 family protein [Bacteroidota bacterium]|nr:phosphatase PAP2 family protein [Bacteroidota bacterium]
MKKITKVLAMWPLLIGLLLLFSCSKEEMANSGNGSKKEPLSKYSNQIILDWNLVALEAMGGTSYQHSLLGAHINAMVHLAMHDALNGVAPTFEKYALQREDAQADPIAAAATAAHTVLITSFPDKKPILDAALAKSTSNLPAGDALNRGMALGKEAGEKILALRQNDGAFQDPIAPIAPSNEPGVYQAVPPFDFVFAPFWKTMKPFSLTSPDQFRCAPQPALNSQVYADAFNEVKTVGVKNSSIRTADESFYTQFWYEFSEMGWNTVARTVAADKKLDLLSTARLFALVDMALADAYTAGWDSKFHYNFWRPFTAIQKAESDGNATTVADSNWEPFMPTPPVQDYPSTHSALGNAAATVLASLLGDETKFTMTSSTAVPEGATRSFTSFSQAAKENADSRVKAGIHFRFSCNAGMDLGQKIGQWTVQNHLQPLSE